MLNLSTIILCYHTTYIYHQCNEVNFLVISDSLFMISLKKLSLLLLLDSIVAINIGHIGLSFIIYRPPSIRFNCMFPTYFASTAFIGSIANVDAAIITYCKNHLRFTMISFLRTNQPHLRLQQAQQAQHRL